MFNNTRNRPLVVYVLMAGLLAVMAVGVGCKPPKEGKSLFGKKPSLVYHVVVSKILTAPSAKVISAVKRAVDAAQLETVSRSTTNLDGLFHVQSALGKEFKIEIEAVSHEQTQIEISALDKTDKRMGQILFDRIVANL